METLKHNIQTIADMTGFTYDRVLSNMYIDLKLSSIEFELLKIYSQKIINDLKEKR